MKPAICKRADAALASAEKLRNYEKGTFPIACCGPYPSPEHDKPCPQDPPHYRYLGNGIHIRYDADVRDWPELLRIMQETGLAVYDLPATSRAME